MSTNATSADPGASLSVSTDVLTEAFVPAEPPAGRRHAQLRRQLLSADIIAGSITGAIAALAAGLSVEQASRSSRWPIGLGWPVLAYVCGLYALDDLRSWASGVGDAPRLAVTSLLISWPVFGLLTALDAAHPSSARSDRRRRHRRRRRRRPRRRARRPAPLARPAPAHADPRLGRRRPAARRSASSATHELGLDPVGYIDDDVHEPGRLGIPRLGTLDSLADLITFGRVDRVMIAFTRASHEDLLHAIRVCRDAGVTVDIVPRLFEFLEGARTIEQVGGMPLLSIQQPTFSPLSRFSKRALDVVGASIALLAARRRCCALIAVAIKLDSRGAGLLHPAALRPRRALLQALQVPLDEGRLDRARARRRRDRQAPGRRPHHRASAASSAASRSTRRRSCSTSSRAT